MIRYQASTNATIPCDNKKFKILRNAKLNPELYYVLQFFKNTPIDLINSLSFDRVVYIDLFMDLQEQYKLLKILPHLSNYINVFSHDKCRNCLKDKPKCIRSYNLTSKDVNSNYNFVDNFRINYYYIGYSYDENYLKNVKNIVMDRSLLIAKEKSTVSDVINLWTCLNHNSANFIVSVDDNTFCDIRIKELNTVFMFNEISNMQLAFALENKINFYLNCAIDKKIRNLYIMTINDQIPDTHQHIEINNAEDIFYFDLLIASKKIIKNVVFCCTIQYLHKISSVRANKCFIDCNINLIDESDVCYKWYVEKSNLTLMDIVTYISSKIEKDDYYGTGSKYILLLLVPIIVNKHSKQLITIDDPYILCEVIKDYYKSYYANCRDFKLEKSDCFTITAFNSKKFKEEYRDKYMRLSVKLAKFLHEKDRQ